MYNTKKDVDNHVRTSMLKLKSEKDRALRGFTIAKLYFKIKEYSTALQYLCSYINVKEDNDQAHKMLGHCYKALKQPSKALQSFQKSLQLNPKQPELLTEVCQMLVDDEQISANKAKYWCELAEAEKVDNESVYALRLKIMNQSNVQSSEIENMLCKEISSRPNDVNPRVRLVRHFLDQQRILDAFKYVHDFELQQNDAFVNSSEWYNTLWTVLSKYEQLADAKKDWNFWLLAALCLERLVFISFITFEPAASATGSTTALTETANLLFRFDQYLFKINQLRQKFDAQKELVTLFLEHYRSQLVLHSVALLFKRELLQKKNKWRETMLNALPLLLSAYHTGPKENKEPWMKHCDENSIRLIQLWHREGAFRCAQAGRVLLSSITEDNKENNKVLINSVFGTQSSGLWSNADELIAQVRKTCVDNQWRRNLFAQLFCNSDQRLKEQTSLLVKSESLSEPIYELPTVATLEEYEEVAQYLRPQSLSHMVYLHLSYDNLANVSAKYFNGLKFSTSNLAFCGAESLNQLDLDSYFYAATLQAQRFLEVNRELSDSYSGQQSQNSINRPRILPFVNMQNDLAKDEQSNWWQIAFKVYKNLVKGENAAQMRSDLQAGIEVVRGQNGPKMDMQIAFKLGRTLAERTLIERKTVERTFVEARADSIYLHGLKMLKLHNRGVLEPFRRTFHYAKPNSNAAERELHDIAEQAVLYVSEHMLKKSQYEEFIDEMNGVPLPFAAYKQAEAYRKLGEASSTPKTARQRYNSRAAECLHQTLALLKSTNFDANHPLNATIHNELKRLQKSSKKFNGDESADFGFLNDGNGIATAHNDSSAYEDAETEFFSPNNLNRSRREVMATLIAQAAQATPVAAAHNAEMDALVKRIATTLDLVKDEIVSTIKPEVASLRQEIVSLTEKVAQLEDTIAKKQNVSEPPSRDDASNVLDDLYMIEDALQNQLYSQSNAAHTNAMFPGGAAVTPTQFGAAAAGGLQQQSQPRIQTPNAVQMQQQAAAAARAAAYNSPMFNPNYAAFNYYTSPYMLAQQGAAAAAANPLLVPAQRGQLGLPYIDPPVPAAPPLFPAPTAAVDNRPNNNGMYNLLNQPQGTLPTLTLPPNSTLSLGQLPTIPPPSAVVPTNASAIATAPAPPPVVFNKALNNQPVEKGPPANVVITSSDPLPNPHSATQYQQQQQPILSVTIPAQHIKQSLVPQPVAVEQPPQQQQTQAITPTTTFGASNSFGSSTFNFGTQKDTTANATSNFIKSFSFKPAVEQALAAAKPEPVNLSASAAAASAAPLNDSSSSELNRTFDENVEYDPRPDFQPIIPLPAEIEVRTGEEDETVMFSEHGKLYRFMDKEWKERGVGTIKILKSKEGQSRILMRRDQTHKICANHKITRDLKLTPKLDKNGYTWAAPDFADGEVRSEVFFLRFKLQETAKKFGNAFEVAQQEDEVLAKKADQKETEQKQQQQSAPFGLAKSSVTQFTASTPASKAEAPKASVAAAAATTTKPLFSPFGGNIAAASTAATTTASTSVSKPLFAGFGGTTATTTASAASSTAAPTPFANFSFGAITAAGSSSSSSSTTAVTTTSITSFSNLFGNSAQPSASPFSVANLNLGGLAAVSKPADSTTTSTTQNTSNVSDVEDEEYVPTAEFKPVIELPDLVDITTGEENYAPLFEHRAKLLRFDKETREWKERGVGNIRLLKHKDDNDDVRLVMRREQIHKLCCNQRIYKDIEFKLAKGQQAALQWVGQDFSENELVTESLTLRFKAAETCKQFLEAIKKAQSEMSEQAKQVKDQAEAKPKETAAPKTTTASSESTPKGFGDAFKPKAGSWACKDCYTNNPAEKMYCAACESPKDDTVPKKGTANALLSDPPKTTFSFGFSNVALSGAPSTIAFGASKPNGGSGFTFGTQPTAVTPAKDTAKPQTEPAKTLANDFGDKFKPKPGSWTCEDCYTSNTAQNIYCAACDAPKDASIPKKNSTAAEKESNKDILKLSNPNQTFSFGFPAPATAKNETATSMATNSAAVAVSTAQTFTFGMPQTKNEPDKLPSTAAAAQPPPMFGLTSTASMPTLSKPTFSFSMQSSSTATDMPLTNPTNAAAQPTTGGLAFSTPFSLNKTDFHFSMTPKKSESESATAADTEGDADDSGLLHEEENNTYFTPVIPLPDKIEVKTGEEDEKILYQHRAKLYRFTDGEWKERGIGDVKILRHSATNKLRVVMRRDQVHKICLNHALNSDVNYTRKDDKAWLFVVNDFSEGEVSLEKLVLRFKTKDIAEDFMTAVEQALSSDGAGNNNDDEDNDDEDAGNENGYSTDSLNESNNTTNTKKLDDSTSSENNQLTTTTTTMTTKKTEDKNNRPDNTTEVEPKWSLEQPELMLPQTTLKPKSAATVTTANTTFNTAAGASTAAATTSPAANRSFSLKQSTLPAPATTPKTNKTPASASSPSAVNFSFAAALKENETAKPSTGGFLFGNSGGNTVGSTGSAFGSSIFSGGGAAANKPIFGQSGGSLFGTTTTNVFTKPKDETQATTTESQSIFGSTVKSPFGNASGSIFGGNPTTTGSQSKSNLFGSFTDGSPLFTSTKNESDNSGGGNLFSGSGSNTNKFGPITGTPIFGATPTFGSVGTNKNGSLFGGVSVTPIVSSSTDGAAKTNANVAAVDSKSTFSFADISSKSGAVDFASIAAASSNNNNNNALGATPGQGGGGFIGLTNEDAFSSFKNRNNAKNNNNSSNAGDADDDGNANDENYDPYYEPIVPLPKEIVVSTGEEEEERLFSERATLFRFDATNKEWKERGVGDLKLLKHKTQNRFRLVLRREQIHKLVLNFAISADFKYEPMNNNPKSFVFAGMNYAESSTGDVERLAVRFKKVELAEKFSAEIKKCKEQIQQNDAV